MPFGLTQASTTLGTILTTTFTAGDDTLNMAFDYEQGTNHWISGFSLQVVPDDESIDLTITPNEPTSRFQLTWTSQDDMLYTVRSSPDLTGEFSTWDLIQADIPASGTGTNTLNIDPVGDRLFYRVEGLPAPPPPPLFSEDFEGGSLPVGWVNTGPGNGLSTDWEVGNPTGGAATGPSAAATGTFCVGTNISANYTPLADVSLVSPSIAIPAAGATLDFNQYIDTDLVGDFGSVRILDADDSDSLIAEVISNLGGEGGTWSAGGPVVLDDATYGGRNIKIEFRFVSNGDGDVWSGFYIDDVTVTTD